VVEAIREEAAIPAAVAATLAVEGEVEAGGAAATIPVPTVNKS